MHRALLPLHALAIPARPRLSRVEPCPSSQQAGRRSRGADGVVSALLPWRGGTCQSSRTGAPATQGGAGGLGTGGWSCPRLALPPPIGVSEHAVKSQLICSCLLWHRWYVFTCSHLCLQPVRLSLGAGIQAELVSALWMEEQNKSSNAGSLSNNLERGGVQEKGFKAAVLEPKWTQICLSALPVSA